MFFVCLRQPRPAWPRSPLWRLLSASAPPCSGRGAHPPANPGPSAPEPGAFGARVAASPSHRLCRAGSSSRRRSDRSERLLRARPCPRRAGGCRREHPEVLALGRAPAETREHADNFRPRSEEETRAWWAARLDWCRQGRQGRALRSAEAVSHARWHLAEGRPCGGPGAGTWCAHARSRAACS